MLNKNVFELVSLHVNYFSVAIGWKSEMYDVDSLSNLVHEFTTFKWEIVSSSGFHWSIFDESLSFSILLIEKLSITMFTLLKGK